MKLINHGVLTGTALTVALLATPTRAAEFEIDSFTVGKNGATWFVDDFSDGVAPPSAPSFPGGAAASYSVGGTAGPEAGGLLSLDPAQGVLATNAAGATRRTLRAALNSNTNSADLASGLKIDDTLSVRGLFNFSSPTGPLANGYGVRFTDRSSAGLFEIAELLVFYSPTTGTARIGWVNQDFAASATSLVESAELELMKGVDQILLRIARPDRTSPDFFASWDYLSGGVKVGGGSFLTPIALFDGESFVRAEIMAYTAVPAAVPLPGTLWLIGAGLLAGLGFARRRQA
jgi:hypothetical protein